MDRVLPLYTPAEVQRLLASRLREAQCVASEMKQETLARNAGVAPSPRSAGSNERGSLAEDILATLSFTRPNG